MRRKDGVRAIVETVEGVWYDEEPEIPDHVWSQREFKCNSGAKWSTGEIIFVRLDGEWIRKWLDSD